MAEQEPQAKADSRFERIMQNVFLFIGVFVVMWLAMGVIGWNHNGPSWPRDTLKAVISSLPGNGKADEARPELEYETEPQTLE